MNVFWIIYFSRKKKVFTHQVLLVLFLYSRQIELYPTVRLQQQPDQITNGAFCRERKKTGVESLGKTKILHIWSWGINTSLSLTLGTRKLFQLFAYMTHTHTELLNRLKFTPQHHALICADLNTRDGAKVPWRMWTRHFISLLSDVSNQFSRKSALEGNPREPLVTCP